MDFPTARDDGPVLSQTLVLDPGVLEDRRFQLAAAPFAGRMMISFKGAQFPREVILFAVFFPVRPTVSCRDLEDRARERHWFK